MKIYYVASEVAPYIKTGGLADVAGALPKTLAKKGHDVRVVLPLYSKISDEFRQKMRLVKTFDVSVSWRNQYCGVYKIKKDNVLYYFIDNEYYFSREKIYGEFDDAERFAFFSKAALDLLEQIDFCPDVINVNDWHTALVPSYLKLLYHASDFYKNIKTVLTIHNLEYQGKFAKETLQDVIGIDKMYMENGYFENDGALNILKAGIISADKVTTVSETYSNEIKTDYYGHGLQHILRQHEGKLTGIVNGIDVDLYSPRKNKHLFQKYAPETVAKKMENKKQLLALLGLEAKEETPVIGIISRFASHKGFDLVSGVLDEILNEDLRLVVLGTGEYKYEQMFKDAKHRYPGKISVNIAFSEDLANKIYSGADMFLMPSISEPCGLAQMISMRYGTLPIVRETGGLSDTVSPCRIDVDEGDGFTFKNINAHDMLYVIKEACGIYREQPEVWSSLVDRAMKKDFSWSNSADKYIAIYEQIVGE